MSKKNGDKARFGKERKKKLLRRKQTLALQQSLTNGAAEMRTESPVPPSAAETTRQD